MPPSFTAVIPRISIVILRTSRASLILAASKSILRVVGYKLRAFDHACFVSYCSGRILVFWIARPISQLTGAISQIAAGNLEIIVPGANRGDEIGDLARSISVIPC
jgi:methyl-accepting chemotaxis protein